MCDQGDVIILVINQMVGRGEKISEFKYDGQHLQRGRGDN